MLKLNVGCGRYPLKDYINLDIINGPGIDIIFDLEECSVKQIPLETSSIDYIEMRQVLEHIKYPLPLMQELWRIAKPNASCLIEVPYGSSDNAWEDQTHVRPYFINSWLAFEQPYYYKADYGYKGDWKPKKITLIPFKDIDTNKTHQEMLSFIRHNINVIEDMQVMLTTIKPVRSCDRSLLSTPEILIQI